VGGEGMTEQSAVQGAAKIQGWMFESELLELYRLATQMPGGIVEIGSWKGRSTFALCAGCPGTVHAVDTFEGSRNEPEHVRLVAEAGGSTYMQFAANLKQFSNLSAIMTDSITAAGAVGDVDMVFIDGGHSYEQVKADLKAWLPKARKLICGHDIEFPDVARAVREVLGEVTRGAGLLWFKWIGNEAKRPKPLFSILHTSARPDTWRKVYDDWMSKAVFPQDVEYVLCVDPRWGFSLDPAAYAVPLDNLHVVQNTGRRCYVDGVNIAAAASTGVLFIVNADDQYTAQDWDLELRTILGRYWNGRDFDKSLPVPDAEQLALREPLVIEVSTGTPDEYERHIMVMPILSRKRYEDQGSEVFHHRYESMFADNDFCEHAIQDNVVIDARHLMFPHRHWLNKQRQHDAVDEAQNNSAAYALGFAVLTERRAAQFKMIRQKTIALCIPGDDFRGQMLDSLMGLQAHLFRNGWRVIPVRESTSNVYVTRENMRRYVMALAEKPDVILWIDHDNPLTPAGFDKLLAGLEAHPEVDGVSGWCWIHNQHKQGFVPSCGEWAPDHLQWSPFPPSFARETELKALECGGFPCFLMRYSALENAGEGAFLPVLDNRLQHGILGEDFAFFRNAEKGGAKFLVDPTVRVPHLKYVECVPVFESDGAPGPVKVACMMRVKNEARWIARVIDSVRELCGVHIYVMEDGSTDDTFAIAQAAGATAWKSPFDGQGLDEKRDKDWLLAKVREACDPDWVLMPDGDEELEAGGCAKIRGVLESNPPVDCFALRILNLWNGVDTIRLDGCYGQMSRQSLFRARTDMTFKPIYEGEGENHNHVVLHVSNAPGLGGLRVVPLNVSLLHYGNMLRADRIRKYRWILSIDPHNEGEDFYRHCVQGDLPEFPADAKFKHGGPLGIAHLPSRMVPKFDVPPQPREDFAMA
jgi:hypothetical protein